MQIPGPHPELLYHMGSRNLWQEVDASCAVKGKHTTLGIQKKKSRFEFSIHHLPAVCAWKPKPHNFSAP